MGNSKLCSYEQDKSIFRFFVIVLDETLNIAPTYLQVRWGTQNYVVVGRKQRICWLILVSECLGHILAVKRCCMLAHGRLKCLFVPR